MRIQQTFNFIASRANPTSTPLINSVFSICSQAEA